MKIWSAAKGECVVCGKDSEGSLYWTPPPKEIWKQVRPHIVAITPVSPYSGVKLVQNVLFIEPHCKPFCSPACVGEYYKDKAADTCKRGG